MEDEMNCGTSAFRVGELRVWSFKDIGIDGVIVEVHAQNKQVVGREDAKALVEYLNAALGQPPAIDRAAFDEVVAAVREIIDEWGVADGGLHHLKRALAACGVEMEEIG